MARQIIDTTTPQPGGKIGDTAKVAFEKTNDNFEELYDAVANIPEDTTADIEALDVRVTANEGEIGALDTRVTANEGAISALQSGVADLGHFADSVEAMTGYIDGLRMEWVSGTSLRVTGGAAYVPGLNGILGVESPISKSGLSLSANTWYHVYLYRNSGAADIEVSTAAPGAPYSGAARTKSGDNSRRYIGSVRTDGAGSIFNFAHVGNQIVYRANAGSPPFVVVGGGSATSPTSVSCSSVAPPTASLAQITASNVTNVGLRILESEGDYGASGRIYGLGAGAVASVPVPLNASREFIYYLTGAASGFVQIELTGYTFER